MYENWGLPDCEAKRGQLRCTKGGGRGLANKSTRAKPKQKTKGPARSASSMMCSSTLLSGLSTVRDLARMCDGLTPISNEGIKISREGLSIEREGRPTLHQPRFTLKPSCAKSLPPFTFTHRHPPLHIHTPRRPARSVCRVAHGARGIVRCVSRSRRGWSAEELKRL